MNRNSPLFTGRFRPVETTESWWTTAPRENFTALAHEKTWRFGATGIAGVPGPSFDPSLAATASLMARRAEWKAQRAIEAA